MAHELIVAPIVEGHGDVSALPILLRKIYPAIQVHRPVRFPKSKLLIGEHLERAVKIASSNIVNRGVVLLVIDADEQCAATIASELQQDANERVPGSQVHVVLAVREFESWIVGGLPEFNEVDPDRAGQLKGRIRALFDVYKETVDQPRLTARIDVEMLLARSRSFRKLHNVVMALSQ